VGLERGNEMNKHEQARQNLQRFHECFYDDSKRNTAEFKRNKLDNYINEAEATEKAYQELQQDIGVLLRVLDAPSDDPEATYILNQIIIKLSKGGVNHE